MSDLIHNERVKLTATLLNSIAVAAVALGGLSPTIAVFTIGLPAVTALALGVSFIAMAGVLHWLGRRRLGGLRP